MAWDDDKTTDTGGATTADEQLTATEWNNHVDDQKGHATRHEDNGVDALTWGNLPNNDSTAYIIDTLSNRPAAGTADRMFVDLTEKRIQRDDGTQWVTVSSGGGGSATVLDSGALGTLNATTDFDDFTVTDVSADETVEIAPPRVRPSTANQFTADYAFNAVDWSQSWDESDGAWDVTITVSWDVASPPGDLALDYTIYEGGGGGSSSSTTTVSETVTVTSNYTSASWNEVVWADTSGGNITVELPPPTNTGQFSVKKTAAANTLTVSRPGTEEIDGDASNLTIVDKVSRTISSDGTNYEII